jgi:hypothetical protein
MRKFAVILIAVGALGLVPRAAEGWDSVTKPSVRDFPTALPFTPGWSSTAQSRRFGAIFLKDAIGGISPNYDDDIANNKILDCPETFLSSSDISKGCVIATDLSKAEFGWLSLRKRGDVFAASEHAEIAKRTAERAGLDQTHLFDVFWLRYASPNGYLASPVKLTPETDLTPPESRYLVGQSCRRLAESPVACTRPVASPYTNSPKPLISPTASPIGRRATSSAPSPASMARSRASSTTPAINS